jgi:subtilase family serine protease
MRRTFISAATTLAAAVGLTVGAVTTTSSAEAAPGLHGQKVCVDAKAGEASCHAMRLVDANGQAVDPFGSTARPQAISGKRPADIQAAYGLTGIKSGGRTVAIVDAYGYPNAERDLGVYRAQFGLPQCSRANGCLTIMNQSGGSSLPRTDVGWSQEQALDLDAVSAACPDCKILLVQASSASFANLGAAVTTAAKQPGVAAISNSYGGGDAADSSYGSYYNHPGIAVTASTGDNGYQGASYPASSSYVTAVGGTSLYADSSTRGWNEKVWSGAGSGCSTLNAALPSASSFSTGCAKRAMADVSAVADPNTGLAVYAPTTSRSSSWAQYGGTSLSSPLIASVYALSGNTGSAANKVYANSLPYAHTGNLNDVTTGSNGTCPTTQWCTARSGWDGPTGLGTPNGTAAF